MRMRLWRRLGRAAAYSAAGYAGVVTASQALAYWEIRKRGQLEDVTQRYAPIKVLGRYINPFDEYRHQTLFEFAFKRIAELFVFHIPGYVPRDSALLQSALPLHAPHFAKAVPKNRAFVTWIGQSCFVAQLNGDVTVLADPMFAEYVVSPNVGPQRIVPPPCLPNDIPRPDVVLVSHDHQDHLDLEAAKQFPDSVFVVPTGVKKWLPASAKCVEMTWWDRIPMPNVDPKLGYEIACTPTMHWSGRKLYDSNTTLWCSFMILRNGRPILFHGGDTGYSQQLFKAIYSVYGPCKLAILPCGAYRPRWHLRAQHMAPFETIQAMRDLHAKQLIGVHWGTFVMSEEPFNEPPALLRQIAEREAVPGVVAPELGKTSEFNLE